MDQRVPQLVERYLADESASDASPARASLELLPAELAQLIVSHQANLLDIVRASGEYLTSDDDRRRGRGIGLLAKVVTKCPKTAVTRQETQTLADFFTSCIAKPLSEEVLVPTLQGQTSLAKLPHFGPLEATSLCKAIFKEVELHGRPQTTRYAVYCLIDALVAGNRTALKRMGEAFLTGYCQLVTGEKDPRNLRLAFGIARVLLVEFDLTDHVEDLFDITFCYFPIMFTPPPNDPYGITSEELQGSLRDCLSATPRFGPLALPLFIEKLQASSSTAKRQTLQALAVCLPVYGRAVLLPHADTLWEAISVEIQHATDDETEECAVKALRVFLATLFPDTVESGGLPQDKSTAVLRKLTDGCLLELKESDKSNAIPAVKILAQSVAASGVLAQYIIPKSFDLLLKVFNLPDQGHQKPAIFRAMGTIIAALRDCPTSGARIAFDAYREVVLSLAASNLLVAATQEQALHCLSQMAQTPESLTSDETAYVLQCISDLLVKPGVDAGSDITGLALDVLVKLAGKFPSEVEAITIPSLFSLIPDKAPAKKDVTAIEDYRLALAGLASLCTLPALFETFLIRILNRIELVSRPTKAETVSDRQTTAFLLHLLATLRTVFERKIALNHTDILPCAVRVTHRLLRLLVQPCLSPAESPLGAVSQSKVVSLAGQVITLAVQQMDSRSQTLILADVQAAFVHGHVQSLFEASQFPAGSSVSFQPLAMDSPPQQRVLRIVYAHALYPMRPEIFASIPENVALSSQLLELAIGLLAKSDSASMLRLLASIVNKKADVLSDLINDILPKYWDSNIRPAATEHEARTAALRAYTWVVRGLLIRSDKRAYDGISRILELFQDPSLNREAARTMVILGQDDDGVISKQNYSVIRLLHKQRFFAFVLPKLVQGYQDSSAELKTPYLVGLSCLLQSMPKQTSTSELPKLLPLLMQALELPELDMRANVADTLTLLVKESVDAIKPHADGLVSTLLRNAICTDPAIDSEAAELLRLSSLKCLTAFPDSFDWLTLHQQRGPVLKMLGRAIDDPKKRVRAEAVDCRARWYLFKAP